MSDNNRTIRHFRGVELKPGADWVIRSVKTGKPVKITVKNLNNYQREILANTCDVIQEKLKGTEFEKPVETLLAVTGLLVTSSRHVNGYSVMSNDDPLIILNSKTFTGSRDEFTVTVLHELLHFLEESDDRDPASLEEARHDLACYGILNVPVPIGHWAFTKYPQLYDEINSMTENDTTSSERQGNS